MCGWIVQDGKDMNVMVGPGMAVHPDLKVGNQFSDFEQPDQDGKMQQLSKLIRGFPTVLCFMPN